MHGNNSNGTNDKAHFDKIDGMAQKKTAPSCPSDEFVKDWEHHQLLLLQRSFALPYYLYISKDFVDFPTCSRAMLLFDDERQFPGGVLPFGSRGTWRLNCNMRPTKVALWKLVDSEQVWKAATGRIAKWHSSLQRVQHRYWIDKRPKRTPSPFPPKSLRPKSKSFKSI